ncbi:MAG TPA: hypothetical protein PKW95_15600 [bacterium]|nr:hypothetical protein [bacterium]
MENSRARTIEVADLLAEGILRKRFRDIQKANNTMDLREKGLEVSRPKSLHRLEPNLGKESR